MFYLLTLGKKCNLTLNPPSKKAKVTRAGKGRELLSWELPLWWLWKASTKQDHRKLNCYFDKNREKISTKQKHYKHPYTHIYPAPHQPHHNPGKFWLWGSMGPAKMNITDHNQGGLRPPSPKGKETFPNWHRAFPVLEWKLSLSRGRDWQTNAYKGQSVCICLEWVAPATKANTLSSYFGVSTTGSCNLSRWHGWDPEKPS